MKKFPALLAALVLALSALMLVACGPGPDDTDGPGTDTDGPGVVDPGDPDDPGTDTEDPEPAATPGLVFELLSEQELAYHNLDYGHTYTAAYAVTNYDVEETEDVTDLVIPSYHEGIPVVAIDVEALAGFATIESVYLPRTLTTIDDGAFAACTALTAVTIPDNVREIGKVAFSYCEKLTDVTLPQNDIRIARDAFDFSACALDEGNTENGALYIDHILIRADQSVSGEFAVREGTVAIADEAFYSCKQLTGVTFPDSLLAIGESAFSRCDRLSGVVIPTSVTRVGRDAFRDTAAYDTSDTAAGGCAYIGDVLVAVDARADTLDIREGTRLIADEVLAFSYNRKIVIPAGLNEFGDNLTQILSPDLEEIEVSARHETLSSEGGVLYNKDKTVLYRYPSARARDTFALPDSVTRIADYAFFMAQVKEVVLGDNVQDIGCGAFSDSALERIAIPDGVAVLRDMLFYDCDLLESVTLGNGVQKIGTVAFDYCLSLTAIELPASVTEIAQHAFNYCDGLENVTFAQAEGWTAGKTPVDAAALADPAQAAVLLTETYLGSSWTRG